MLISEEDFETIYDPQESPNGTLYWDYEQIPANTPVVKVWSLVDGEGNSMYALPGYRVVNVFGYTITEKSWTNKKDQAVWIPPHCLECGNEWTPTEPPTTYADRCEICGNCQEHHLAEVHLPVKIRPAESK
jgi:hypothetical protein